LTQETRVNLIRKYENEVAYVIVSLPTKLRARGGCRRSHKRPPAALRRRHCHIVKSPAAQHDVATHMSGPTTSAAARAVVRDGLIASPLLGPLVVDLLAVFQKEVLEKWLDPTDRALLARAC